MAKVKNHKKNFERKYRLSLTTIDAVVFQKELDYGVIKTTQLEEDAHQISVCADFFKLSQETRQFLLLGELMGHVSFSESQRKDLTRLQLAIESDFMAGEQLDFINPAGPAIRSLEELSQLNLGTEEQLDIQERLDALYPRLLSEQEVIDLIHEMFADDSNSDDAYEASWNGAED